MFSLCRAQRRGRDCLGSTGPAGPHRGWTPRADGRRACPAPAWATFMVFTPPVHTFVCLKPDHSRVLFFKWSPSAWRNCPGGPCSAVHTRPRASRPSPAPDVKPLSSAAKPQQGARSPCHSGNAPVLPVDSGDPSLHFFWLLFGCLLLL